MTTRRAFLTVLFAGASVTSAFAGGQKRPDVDISFHLQAEEGDNPKMVFTQKTAGKMVPFKKLSEVNTRDIAAFEAFPSRDGEGYGLQVQLKPGAVIRIQSQTTANPNRWILAVVNGRPVDAVLIDKPVDDGTLVIWKGVSLGEIQQLDKTIPRLGQKKPKGNTKKD